MRLSIWAFIGGGLHSRLGSITVLGHDGAGGGLDNEQRRTPTLRTSRAGHIRFHPALDRPIALTVLANRSISEHSDMSASTRNAQASLGWAFADQPFH